MSKIILNKYTREAAEQFADNEGEIHGFDRESPRWETAFKKSLSHAYSTMSVGRNPRSCKKMMCDNPEKEYFDYAGASNSELIKRYEKNSKKLDKLVDYFINHGMGHIRPSDMRAMKEKTPEIEQYLNILDDNANINSEGQQRYGPGYISVTTSLKYMKSKSYRRRKNPDSKKIADIVRALEDGKVVPLSDEEYDELIDYIDKIDHPLANRLASLPSVIKPGHWDTFFKLSNVKVLKNYRKRK